MSRGAKFDRKIQLEIARSADRDSTNMKIIAILTALFLPGTFMAVWNTIPPCLKRKRKTAELSSGAPYYTNVQLDGARQTSGRQTPI